MIFLFLVLANSYFINSLNIQEKEKLIFKLMWSLPYSVVGKKTKLKSKWNLSFGYLSVKFICAFNPLPLKNSDGYMVTTYQSIFYKVHSIFSELLVLNSMSF